MTCSDIVTAPYPACATTLYIGTTNPTAPPHRAHLRNLATGRMQEVEATVDGTGVIVNLAAPLQPGHEYTVELWDYNQNPNTAHEITICGMTGYVVRIRPEVIYGPDGLPISDDTAVIQCPFTA